MAEFTEGERSRLIALLNEQECRRLLEHYTCALDWMNWDGLSQLFWTDARFDFGLWAGESLAEFIPWVTELESGYRRRLHLFGIPRIRLRGDAGEGEVVAAMYFRVEEAQTEAEDELMLGRYLFQFEKRDSEWRISDLKVLMNGARRFPATDSGGAAFFADGLNPQHPLFPQWK